MAIGAVTDAKLAAPREHSVFVTGATSVVAMTRHVGADRNFRATVAPIAIVLIGVGRALLLDATVSRSIIRPTAVRLLGRRTWYLPARLRRLPRLQIEGRR